MQKALKGYRTKRKLADTLKEVLNTKPLEKVRIHELTERCDIHRQTFYYHFADVYALFSWCVQQEAEALSVQLEQFSSWQEALESFLQYAAEKRGYFTAILDHSTTDGKQAFFDKILAAILDKVPYSQSVAAKGPDLSQLYLRSLSLMLLTLLEKWIRGDINQPEDIIGFLEKLAATKALA